MQNIKCDSKDKLFRVILNLQTLEECYDFFQDICTMKELRDISQRLEVAELLSKGFNYQDISAKTGISSATISRVNNCLTYGTGGYRMVLDREAQRETEAKE